MALDPKIHKAVYKHVVAAKRLNFEREIDQHKGYFANKRTALLFEAMPAFFGGATSEDKLKARVSAEIEALEAFLAKEVGKPTKPGPVLESAEGKALEHLDLADMGRVFSGERATTLEEARKRRGKRGSKKEGFANSRTWKYVKLRHKRCHAIVWRAAALHPELWEDFSDELDADLREPAMYELLDRRLRVVERMNFQIGSRVDMGAKVMDMGKGADKRPFGPWDDGLRLRMFEYPELSATDEAIDVLGAQIGPPGSKGQDFEWRYSFGFKELYWNRTPGTRVTAAVEDSFPVHPADDYIRWLDPNGSTAAEAIAGLFVASTDFWDRTWWYCDHAIASLHVEALRFAKCRRTGRDKEFNDFVAARRGYVQFKELVGVDRGADKDHLMADDRDPYFDNTAIELDELELGDQLIFYSSILYSLVADGAWELENAVVTDLQSIPETAGVSERGTRLQGHGTAARTIMGYPEILMKPITRGLNQLRGEIEASGPGVTELPGVHPDRPLVKWAPYPDVWRPPGPWWVRIEPRQGETDADTLKLLRSAVQHDPGRGGDYQPPPVSGSLFFPLYVPQLAGGWNAYLRQRESGPIRKLNRELHPFRFKREMVPGLHYGLDRTKPFGVVRPKVQP